MTQSWSGALPSAGSLLIPRCFSLSLRAPSHACQQEGLYSVLAPGPVHLHHTLLLTPPWKDVGYARNQRSSTLVTEAQDR